MKIYIENITSTERQYLESVLANGKALTLEELWALVDDAWEKCQCDPNVMDDRVERFYAHPVWLLNGLFIEQHAESIHHRRTLTKYIASLKPKRVADFGGGYGSLARFVGKHCPEAEVHIIEPHPHRTAVSLANRTPNVRYVSGFIGEYDVIIATDVFEHVPDPLALVENTSAHLKIDGEYIIANCFWPVVRCHLPSTFHFRWSWDYAMVAMNLLPGRTVAYGRAYRRLGQVSASASRIIESRSKRWFWLIEKMPGRARGRVAHLLITGCKSCFRVSKYDTEDMKVPESC